MEGQFSKVSGLTVRNRGKILENAKVSVKHDYIDLYFADCNGDGRCYTRDYREMPKKFSTFLTS